MTITCGNWVSRPKVKMLVSVSTTKCPCLLLRPYSSYFCARRGSFYFIFIEFSGNTGNNIFKLAGFCRSSFMKSLIAADRPGQQSCHMNVSDSLFIHYIALLDASATMPASPPQRLRPSNKNQVGARPHEPHLRVSSSTQIHYKIIVKIHRHYRSTRGRHY